MTKVYELHTRPFEYFWHEINLEKIKTLNKVRLGFPRFFILWSTNERTAQPKDHALMTFINSHFDHPTPIRGGKWLWFPQIILIISWYSVKAQHHFSFFSRITLLPDLISNIIINYIRYVNKTTIIIIMFVIVYYIISFVR